MSSIDRLRALVLPLVEERGLELYDIEQSGPTLQILVSGPRGVDVGALSDLSRAVSRTLDEHDPIPGKYVLEVSSPGLERPLRRPEHYQGAVGSDVTVKTVAGTEGDRRVRGVVVEADETSVLLALPEGGERRIEYRDIERARTVFEWEATPKSAAKARRKNDHSDRHAVTATPTDRSGK